MSHCPTCQRPCPGPFCDRCFQSLAPEAPGRFVKLLSNEWTPLNSPASAQGAAPADGDGPDLSRLRYEAPPWWRRRLGPGVLSGLRSLGAVAVLTLLAFGCFSLYRLQQARQHRQQALSLLQQAQQARSQQHWEEALVLAERGLHCAERSGDPVLDHELRLMAGRLAFQARQWEVAYRHLRAAQAAPAELMPALENLRRQQRGQALALMATARQQVAAGDAAGALQSANRAQGLLEVYRGSPHQLAEVHYLKGRALQRMGLKSDARDELRLALQLEASHARAGQLLAQLEALGRPAPRQVQRPATPLRPPSVAHEVLVPRLDTDPGYPTYQPRDEDEDEDEDRLGSRTGSASARSSSSDRRRGRRNRQRLRSSESSRYSGESGNDVQR